MLVQFTVHAHVADGEAAHVLAHQLHGLADGALATSSGARIEYKVEGAHYGYPHALPAHLGDLLATSLEYVRLSRAGRVLAEEHGLTAHDFKQRRPMGSDGVYSLNQVREVIAAL